MAMGCHKSVYRVKPCDTVGNKEGPIYILSSSAANETAAPTSLEAEMLQRSVPGTVPSVHARCSNADGSNFFLVQEMLMGGTSYSDIIKQDEQMSIFSPVARLRIAASGFEALNLFDNFPLKVSDTKMQANMKFSSGATDERGWFQLSLDDNPSTEWRNAKVFYRDFGPGQVGISVEERKMKVIDILSPFYLLYEGIGKGVGSELPCSSDDDCHRGFNARYLKTSSTRYDKTVPRYTVRNTTDHINDISCDTTRGQCMGLDDRTQTYFMWWFFQRTLESVKESSETKKIHAHLDRLLKRISHEDRNERPMPSTVAAELYAIADILEKSGARDWIDEESSTSIRAKPWVTASWTKVCKNSIGVRQAVPLVSEKVTLVGDCELRWRGYNAASS